MSTPDPPSAAVRTFDCLLRPRSVAIVGASATPGALGLSVLRNLEAAEFAGEIFLINPKRDSIEGRACLASVDLLPANVDCAVLAIPQAGVLSTLRACAARGVGAAVVFSAGFAESGAAGLVEQQEIARLSKESGMVIEGPNCLGMVNFHERIPLTFVDMPLPIQKAQPSIAIVSQSGAMAAVLAVSLRARDLPLSYSVSTGNEAASGVEDFIEAMIAEPHTSVIAMIVEQFRQPMRFLHLAAVAERAGKRIVLLHPGSSGAARASAATHTGALAGNYVVMRMKCAHAGILAVETLEELTDVAEILLRCPRHGGGGTAVFTESGAFKALSLDLCERLGLPLPSLQPHTEAALRAVLPDFIPVSNPLDLTAQGLVDPEIYRKTLPAVLAEERFGAVLLSIILSDPATAALKLPPILTALSDLQPGKPVLFAAMDEGARFDQTFVQRLRALGVPFFPSPERAFRALARVTAGALRSPTRALTRQPSMDLPEGVLPEHIGKLLLAEAGVPTPAGALATTLEQAQAIASRIGFPAVLKAQASALAHKTEAGGVVLNLRDAAGLAEAWTRMHAIIAEALPGLALDGVLVEAMAKPGVELIIGAHRDPDWGPVLLVGFGGVMAEALKDVRLLPPDLARESVIAEMHLLKGAALLRGFRGSPPLDVQAVAELVERLGDMMLSNPKILEVDMNPVVVYAAGQGAVALDALIVVASAVE